MKNRSLRLMVLVLLTPLVLFLCVLLGSSGIGFPDTASAAGRAILWLRIHRVLTGMIVGAALSCAGVIFQALLRNPLAEPYILGVSSGAGLGAALAILTGFGALNVFALPVTAFLAAGLTLAIVFALSQDGGSPSVYGLILSGVIVSAICSSVLMFLISIAPVEGLHSVMWWILGNLQPVSRELLTVCAILILLGIGGAWMIGPELNALTLGREAAHHVGVRTSLIVTLGLVLATLITASAVGLAGLIGFVGLIVPHVTRRLFGPDHRLLIPAAAISGGLFLAVCDGVARTVMAPVEIPVGVITAICGGPFFLIILRRKRKPSWVE